MKGGLHIPTVYVLKKKKKKKKKKKNFFEPSSFKVTEDIQICTSPPIATLLLRSIEFSPEILGKPDWHTTT